MTVTCTPPSGATFGLGSTTVVCRAVDARERTASCNFAVTVAAPPRLTRTRFLAFGDSLTEGKPGPLWSLVEFEDAYSRDLQALLQSRYTAQTPVVVNRAFGGFTATELLALLPGVLSEESPQVMLLMAGANDIARTDGNLYVYSAGEAIRQMVTLAQNAGAVVLLATLPPEREGAKRGKGAPFVPLLNEYVRLVAGQTNATVVDVYEAFNGQPTPDLVDADGLHLTKAGYERVAQAFFTQIQATLELK